MSAAKQDERDWELEALASAISSFFKRRVGGEEGKALAGLTRELAARAGSGSSHLGSDHADEILLTACFRRVHGRKSSTRPRLWKTLFP